jgi:sensor histidine kinase YesM
MISSRMYEDPVEADRMLSRLSDLLRFSLNSAEEQQVLLRTEMEMLELYLEIMKARFGDSVQVRVEVDRKAQHVMVPTLILQPIVENAFRHGLANKSRDGILDVRAFLDVGKLNIAVRDNGPGMNGSKGFGLTNTMERLQRIYGDRHRMILRNLPAEDGGGLEVLIEIPSSAGG